MTSPIIFNLVISTDDVTRTKPDPEAVIKATNTLNIKRDEVLVVGDSKNDILMGNSAGSKTVLFFPTGYDFYYDFEEIKKANSTYIISEISELKNYLK